MTAALRAPPGPARCPTAMGNHGEVRHESETDPVSPKGTMQCPDLTALWAEVSMNPLLLLTWPSSAFGGFPTSFLPMSGVFIMRSIRGWLLGPKAMFDSGVLLKSMRGQSARSLSPASGVMVRWSSLMSRRP